MALQAATLSRASSSTLAAAVKGDKKARVAMIEAEEMCIFWDLVCAVNQPFERHRVCLVLCHSVRSLGWDCSSTTDGPDIVARLEAT
jgi:hypothetical protein